MQDAWSAVDAGAAWAIVWCEGGISRSTDSSSKESDLQYVRRHLIEPDKRRRLFEKARRKGHTKTVIMAERWENTQSGPLVLFYESGPYLLPERSDPFLT